MRVRRTPPQQICAGHGLTRLAIPSESAITICWLSFLVAIFEGICEIYLGKRQQQQQVVVMMMMMMVIRR